MTTLQHTVEIEKADEPIALRLLSALILGWDALPDEIQVRLLRDAALMGCGFPNATVLPARIMAFVGLHKKPSCVGQATADHPTVESAPMRRLRGTG
jgi:hypothetical protein